MQVASSLLCLESAGLEFLLKAIDLHMLPIFWKFQVKMNGSRANLMNKMSSAIFCATAKFVCCLILASDAFRAMCITTMEGSVQVSKATVNHRFMRIN